jgi:hypothetical protein
VPLRPTKPEEVETLLRSAAMAPLSRETVYAALEAHRDLARERAELERLMHQAMPSWRNLRTTLNRIAHLLGETGGAD